MKGRTAYFVFAEEQRQSSRDELLAEMGEGAKVSVAEVAKIIGQKWKQLSDDEKAEYKQKAQEQAEADKQAAVEAGDAHEQQAEQAEEAKESSPLDGLLPLSVVRRIVLADKEVSRVSHDGLIAVAMAVDLLLGTLAKQTAGVAKSSKRRTLQLKDFVQAVKQDRRIAQAGLRDVEAAVHAAVEGEAEAKGNNAKQADQGEVAGDDTGGVEGVAEDGAAVRQPGDAAGDEEVGPAEDGTEEVENQDPAQGEAASAAGGKAGRGRPKGVDSGAKRGGGLGGGSKKQKAQNGAAAGARRIDTFFSKRQGEAV